MTRTLANRDADMSGDIFTRDRFGWLRQVASDHEVSPAAFRLAFAIMEHVNRRSGTAWPTQETLGNAIHATTRTVRALTKTLETRGHIFIRAGRGRQVVNVYSLVEKWKLIPSGQMGSDAQSFEKMGRLCPPIDDEERKSAARTPEMSCTKTGNAFPAEPSHEPEEEPCDKSIPNSSRLNNPRTANDIDQGFDAWWNLYPRRVARGEALRAWRQTLRSKKATVDQLLEGARRYAKARREQDPRFTKYPASWLRAECWADEEELIPEAALRLTSARPMQGFQSAMVGAASYASYGDDGGEQ